MADTFDNQKEVLLALKKEINLLRQQVDFLIRNEKELGLLDLDILMNRTHTVYDMLCSVNLHNPDEEEETGMDAELLMNEIFGGTASDEEEEEKEETEEEPQEETVNGQECEPMQTTEQEQSIEAEEEPGFSFRLVEETETETEDPVYQDEIKTEETAVKEEPTEQALEEKPKTIVHIIEPFDDEKDLDEPEIQEEDKSKVVELSVNPQPKIQVETPVVNEVTPAATLTIFSDLKPEQEVWGEKMQQQEDKSLAARLQKKPVCDLKTAIGINDRFLFVNELFGGSMEKYNKSIGNLNDLKTLNGALIYLNELKIELQWNSNNEAYKKLSNLISRKFEN
jgi:hypothetical protein